MRNHLFLSFYALIYFLFVSFPSFNFILIFFLVLSSHLIYSLLLSSFLLISSILFCSLHFFSSHVFSPAPFISSLLLPCCPRGPLIVFLVLHCERLQSPANKQIQIGHMIINRYAVKFNDGQIRR